VANTTKLAKKFQLGKNIFEYELNTPAQ